MRQLKIHVYTELRVFSFVHRSSMRSSIGNKKVSFHLKRSTIKVTER